MNDMTKAYAKIFREECDLVLYDIAKRRWTPTSEELKGFCIQLYRDLVGKFREYETTREYLQSGEVLAATGCDTGNTFAYTAGAGITESESVATHAVGCELSRLIRDYRETEPIDFDFLIVLYKTIDPESLPVRELETQLSMQERHDPTVH